MFICGLIFNDERTQYIVLDYVKECETPLEELLQLLSLAY